MPQIYIFRIMYILEPIRYRPAGAEIAVREITVVNKPKSVSSSKRISQNRSPSGGGMCSNIN